MTIARIAVGVAGFALFFAVAPLVRRELRYRDIPRFAAHSWRRRK